MANELAAKLERQRLAADTGVAPAPRVSKGGPLNVYTEFPEFTRKQVMCLSSSSPLRRSVGLRPLGQCLLAVIMPQVARVDVAMLTSPSARFTFSHGDARHFEFGVWRRAHTSQASSLECNAAHPPTFCAHAHSTQQGERVLCPLVDEPGSLRDRHACYCLCIHPLLDSADGLDSSRS